MILRYWQQDQEYYHLQWPYREMVIFLAAPKWREIRYYHQVYTDLKQLSCF